MHRDSGKNAGGAPINQARKNVKNLRISDLLIEIFHEKQRLSSIDEVKELPDIGAVESPESSGGD